MSQFHAGSCGTKHCYNTVLFQKPERSPNPWWAWSSHRNCHQGISGFYTASVLNLLYAQKHHRKCHLGRSRRPEVTLHWETLCGSVTHGSLNFRKKYCVLGWNWNHEFSARNDMKVWLDVKSTVYKGETESMNFLQEMIRMGVMCRSVKLLRVLS